MTEFKKGDIVKLKSGGPKMTIIRNTVDILAKKTLDNKFDCVWFERDEDPKQDPHYGEFFDYTLELVQKPD